MCALNNRLSLGEDDNVFETNKIAKDFDIREGFSLIHSSSPFDVMSQQPSHLNIENQHLN